MTGLHQQTLSSPQTHVQQEEPDQQVFQSLSSLPPPADWLRAASLHGQGRGSSGWWSLRCLAGRLLPNQSCRFCLCFQSVLKCDIYKRVTERLSADIGGDNKLCFKTPPSLPLIAVQGSEKSSLRALLIAGI